MVPSRSLRMKYDLHKAFPHPVLREQIPAFADYDRAQIQSGIRLNKKASGCTLQYRVQISVPEIKKLIESEQAQVVISAECKRTSKAFWEVSSSLTGEFPIDTKDFEGDVDFCTSVIVKCDELEYTSGHFHPELAGMRFTLRRGDPLAIARTTSFSFSRDNRKPLSHLFEVAQSERQASKEWTVDYEGQKITIRLGRDAFETLSVLGATPDGRKVVLASFLTPAMVEVLAALRADNDLVNQYRWAKTLYQRIENLGLSLDRDGLTKIATKIWDYPEALVAKLILERNE